MVGPVDAILEAGKTNRGRRAVNAVSGRWRGLPPWARTAVTLGAALVAIEVGLAAINFATGGAGPSGPASSAYATSHRGLAAYAELLSSRGGHAVVRERRALADAGLDPADTVVLLDPGRVAESDTSALLAFVESGGRLIAGGRDPAWLDRIIDGAPDWAPPGVDRATPMAPAPETGGVTEVVSAGAGSWSEDNGALAILGGEDGTLVSVAAVGEGRIVLLADASPLQNRLLGNADNAAFGLAAAGARGRTVLFGEEAHGFEEATGLAALPAAWRVSLAGVALAAVLWLWSRARRLGPPDTDDRPGAPPRRAYADALAAALARTRRRDEAVAPVVAAIRRRLAARSGEPESDPDGLRRAASTYGLTGTELDSLFRRAESDADVLAVGRALARVSGGGAARDADAVHPQSAPREAVR